MKKIVQLLRLKELTPLLVMNYVFNDLVPAFEDYGCKIKICNSLTDIEDGGIIFLDDAAYKSNRAFLELLGEKFTDTVFICWYFLDPTFKPFRYMIHTGEFNLKAPTVEYYYQRYMNYMQLSTYAPLKLRVNESPNAIGKYPRNVIMDYCYMGAYYKRDWVPVSYKGIYHTGPWNVYLPSEKRREIYLSSMFALGFQGDENIDGGHLSQRIFEGMAYGCIVLCENKLASEFTDGVVVYISSKEDLIDKIKYYKSNPHLVLEKQKDGYEWVRKFGTNRVSAKVFVEKIKQLFNLDFE